MRGQSAQFDLRKSGVALLLAELDHRIRNLLTTIEAAVKQTHSTTVEDYRAKLIARITGLYSFCEFPRHYGRRLGLAQLLEQSMRPYSANGARTVLADERKREAGTLLAARQVECATVAAKGAQIKTEAPLSCMSPSFSVLTLIPSGQSGSSH